MISPKIKKKTSNSTSLAEKKMKKIQKQKAERIKEKLSGKNYSPIVATAQSIKGAAKKKVPTSSPLSTTKKPSLPKSQKSTGKISKAQPKSEVTSVLPVAESKAEGKIEKKNLKRKPEEAAKILNKKTKVGPTESVIPKETKPEAQSLRTSPREKKAKTQNLEPVKTDSKVTTKPKKTKALKKVNVSNEDGKTTSSNETKTTKKKKQSLKLVEANKPEVDNVKVGESEKSLEQPVASRRKGLRGKKASGIAKLKPISNIRSLKKRPPASVLKAKALKQKEKVGERGVCYFSHIPHGFYEKELEAYCSQFGAVTGVYHPVSKNGNSRGYAFVEFRDKEVAEVVADTMNNYLMFNRLIKCKYIGPEDQRPSVFRHKRSNFKLAEESRARVTSLRNRALSKEEEAKWQNRKLKRVNSLHKKLAALGVDYEFQVNDGSEEKKEEASTGN